MKVLVTGAHFTPAVATIEQLKKMDQVEIVYVGRKTTLEGDSAPSVESQLLPSLGVKFIPIIAGRLQRIFSIYTIPSLFKIPIGLVQAFYIILSEKPDVILSFGGYISVPIVFVGWLWSVPIIVHEQTLVFGLANRICSLLADKIAISFEKSDYKGGKVILTGNPIRQEIVEISKGVNLTHLFESEPQSRRPKGGLRLPTILVIGGNQGSHVINLAMEEVLSKLLKIAKVYHQTGDSKYKDYDRLTKVENDNYKVFKFIGKQWADILRDADLIISRAGINSLTELAYMGKPTLFIPIPGKEQRVNAEYFAGIGLGKVLPQSQLSGETLLEKIRLMLNNLIILKEKATNAKKIIIPDAAKRLALETYLLKNPGVSR